jgi:hypothetical protein
LHCRQSSLSCWFSCTSNKSRSTFIHLTFSACLQLPSASTYNLLHLQITVSLPVCYHNPLHCNRTHHRRHLTIVLGDSIRHKCDISTSGGNSSYSISQLNCMTYIKKFGLHSRAFNLMSNVASDLHSTFKYWCTAPWGWR